MDSLAHLNGSLPGAALARSCSRVLVCAVAFCCAVLGGPGGAPASLLPTLDLQVFLDRSGFSPGEIDGRDGSNLTKAIRAFQKAKGLPPSGRVDRRTQGVLLESAAADALIDYTVTAEDVAGPFLDNLPQDLMEQARLPGLYYTSRLEALAEKFHSAPALIQRLNPASDFSEGDRIRVPNVETATVPGAGSVPGGVVLTVVRSSGTLSVSTADGKPIFHAPVTEGSRHDPLPRGKWKVTGVQRRPAFHYNPDLFWDADNKQGRALIAPGPNNPVGEVWIDISKPHYGIHGTPDPALVGHAYSHGCLRLTNWDALRVAAMVKPGTPVIFR